MQNIPEKDWKQLKVLHDKLLTMACEKIFDEIEIMLKARKGKEHESYLKLWDFLQSEDKEIAIMFNDLKRSNAMLKLASWKRNNLLSEGDLKYFTDETQNYIKALG